MSNLLELQELLRNIPMGAVKGAAGGQHPTVPQWMAMDEIKRRGENMKAEQAQKSEEGIQDSAMIEQYLAAAQQLEGGQPPMGQPPMGPPPMGPPQQGPPGMGGAPPQMGQQARLGELSQMAQVAQQRPAPRSPMPRRPPMQGGQGIRQLAAGGGLIKGYTNGGVVSAEWEDHRPGVGSGGRRFRKRHPAFDFLRKERPESKARSEGGGLLQDVFGGEFTGPGSPSDVREEGVRGEYYEQGPAELIKEYWPDKSQEEIFSILGELEERHYSGDSQATGYLNAVMQSMGQYPSREEYSESVDGIPLPEVRKNLLERERQEVQATLPGQDIAGLMGPLTERQALALALPEDTGDGKLISQTPASPELTSAQEALADLQRRYDELSGAQSSDGDYQSLNEIIMNSIRGDPEKELAQKKFNAWQALAMGGAAAMGSGDPSALGAIGKGAQEGLGSFATAQNVDIAQRGKSLDRAIQLADVEARSREKSSPPTFLEWQKDTWPKLAKEMGFVMETMGMDAEALIELQKSVYEKSYGRMRRSTADPAIPREAFRSGMNRLRGGG